MQTTKSGDYTPHYVGAVYAVFPCTQYTNTTPIKRYVLAKLSPKITEMRMLFVINVTVLQKIKIGN